jgi:hypothetical protein
VTFTEGALPRWLKTVWFCIAPLGLPFAALIGYEKWRLRGSYTLFSLSYLHPDFFLFGSVCGVLMIAWTLAGITFLLLRWEAANPADTLMLGLAVLAAIALVIPG